MPRRKRATSGCKGRSTRAALGCNDATAALLSHLHDYGDYALHPVMGRTFPSPLPRRALDFVFVPPGCRLVHSEVVRLFLSDHRPVMVEFSVA